MRKLLLLLMTFFPLCCIAQNVTDVDFRQVGNTIEISYSLQQESEVKIYLIRGSVMQLIQCTGDVGKHIPAGYHKALWYVVEQYGKLSGEIQFYVEAQPESCWLLSVGPYISNNTDWGMVARVGVGPIYASVKTNFVRPHYVASSRYAANTFFDKKSDELHRAGIDVGIMWYRNKRVSFYTGAGYGIRNYIARQYGTAYIIKENSAKGLEVDVGLDFLLKSPFGVSLGMTVLAWKYTDFNATFFLKL